MIAIPYITDLDSLFWRSNYGKDLRWTTHEEAMKIYIKWILSEFNGVLTTDDSRNYVIYFHEHEDALAFKLKTGL